MDKLQGENKLVDVFGKNDEYIPIVEKGYKQRQPIRYKRPAKTSRQKVRQRTKRNALFGAPSSRFKPKHIIVPHKNSSIITFTKESITEPHLEEKQLKPQQAPKRIPDAKITSLTEGKFNFRNRYDKPIDERTLKELKTKIIQSPHDEKLRKITTRMLKVIENYSHKKKKKRTVPHKEEVVEESKMVVVDVESDIMKLESGDFTSLPKRERASVIQEIIDNHALRVPRKTKASVLKSLREKLSV